MADLMEADFVILEKADVRAAKRALKAAENTLTTLQASYRLNIRDVIDMAAEAHEALDAYDAEAVES